MSLVEPVIHSGITDCLPENNRLAYTSVYCSKCNEMVHAVNNECMQTWVESGMGNYCIKCFAEMIYAYEDYEDDFALTK